MNTPKPNIKVIAPRADYEKIPGKVIRAFDVVTIGVYAKLVTEGKNWNLNIKGLARSLGISEDKARKAITELEAAGYIVRTAVQEHGRMCGWEYTINGNGVDEDQRTKAGYRLSQKPTRRYTDKAVNGQEYNNKLKSNYRLKNNNKDMAKPTYQPTQETKRVSLQDLMKEYGC